MKKVVVGSDNPAKVAAVEKVIKKIWPQAKIISLKVSSGVKPQPLSDKEAIQGAKNRAKKALEKTQADLAFGLEGCTVEIQDKMFVTGWVAVINKKGQVGLGSSGRLLLPPTVAQSIKKGQELGPVMDQFIGQKDTRKKQGAAGILTNNLINRTFAFETGLIFSLAPFLNPGFYRDKIQTVKSTLTIFTDGGAINNPGPAAVGVVIKKNGQTIQKISKPIGETTNNVAEYTAVIEALKWLKSSIQYPVSNIQFFLDSKLVVNQLNGIFKIKNYKLRNLAIKIRQLEKEINAVFSYQHIRREKNQEADSLVKKAFARS